MSEKPPIEFYLDFISPYGYFGSHMIEEVASKHGRRVDWRPMLLGVAVMKVMGLKPLLDTPLKGPYIKHDAPRFARMLGLPFNRSEEMMQPLPVGRAFTWLKDRDDETAKQFARAVMNRYWSNGELMDVPEKLAEEAVKLGVDGGELMAALADDAVKARHREWVDLSLARGVFGAPTFIVDGEMFWGADRVWMVDRWLETGGW